MQDLKALLERLEAVDGPSEQLSLDLLEALGIASYIPDWGDPLTSLDAALALCEACKLRGARPELLRDAAEHVIEEGWDPDQLIPILARHICRAVVRSKLQGASHE